MGKKDLGLVTIIGAAIGLLIQPILVNLVVGSPRLQGLVGGTELAAVWKAGTFFFFLFLAPIALTVGHVLNRIIPIYQFTKFAAVGALNSFISAGMLNLLSLISGATSGFLIPIFSTIAFVTATTNSFFWNKFWTFQAGGKIEAGETAKFYTIATIGAGLSVGTVSIVVNYLRPERIASELWLNVGALCGIAASFLWNFFGYKYIVFKRIEADMRG